MVIVKSPSPTPSMYEGWLYDDGCIIFTINAFIPIVYGKYLLRFELQLRTTSTTNVNWSHSCLVSLNSTTTYFKQYQSCMPVRTPVRITATYHQYNQCKLIPLVFGKSEQYFQSCVPVRTPVRIIATYHQYNQYNLNKFIPIV